MLVALFALLFLGGGGDSYLLGRIDMIIDNVKTEVQSEDRREQAVEILKAAEDDTEDFKKRQLDRAEDLDRLNKTRDFDTAAADAVWDAVFNDVEGYHELLLSRRQELKSVVSRDEWARVFAPGAAD